MFFFCLNFNLFGYNIVWSVIYVRSKKEEKVTFTKEIDSEISGYALTFTLIILGIALQFFPKVFGNVDKAVSISFIILGFLSLYSELQKAVKKYDVKGFDDIFSAVVLFIILFGIKYLVKVNIGKYLAIVKFIYIFFIMVVVFGFISGIIKMGYSLYLYYKKDTKRSKKKYFNSAFKFIVKIFGLLLVILQIVEIIKSLN